MLLLVAALPTCTSTILSCDYSLLAELHQSFGGTLTYDPPDRKIYSSTTNDGEEEIDPSEGEQRWEQGKGEREGDAEGRGQRGCRMAALYPPADSLVLREMIECELQRDPSSSPFSPLRPILPLSSNEGGRAGVPSGGRDTGGFEPSWSPQDERVARKGEREQSAWQDGGDGRQVDADGRREGGVRRYGDAGGATEELSRGGVVVEGTETSGEAAKREGEGDWVGGDEEEEIPSWLVEAAEHLERLVSLEELQGEGETSPIAQAIKFMGVAAAGLPEVRAPSAVHSQLDRLCPC